MTTNLVTGVAGFIGSHLAQTLLERGETVIGLDHFNDYYSSHLKRMNIKKCQEFSSFKLVDCDICSTDWIPLLSEVKVIYHQAAQAGVRASWGHSFLTYTQRNINATQFLLESAKEMAHLKRFVFASSSSVYGDAATLPTSEELCPRPVSPYGITKLAAESLCQLYHSNFGVPVTMLRYFTVYGPRQRPDMAFHKFFRQVIANEPIFINGNGEQTRDFTFISDAIAANIKAASTPESVGQIFNIGGGSRVSLLQVIDTMEQIVGRPIHRQHRNWAKGDARHTSANINKAQSLLGYQPNISLKEGLEAEWNWIQSLYPEKP